MNEKEDRARLQRRKLRQRQQQMPRRAKIFGMKRNTINSLKEVEYFLNNSRQIIQYIKLYKILK